MPLHSLVFLLFMSCNFGTLKDDSKIIASEYLVTNIEYFLHDANEKILDKPIYYFTDGKKMMENGILEQLITLENNKKIAPAYYVFVSTIDAETKEDKRNDYFFCNEAYLNFFEKELIPTVEQQLNHQFDPKNSSLVGVSFGGLNAAFFAAKSNSFQNYGLLSPITYPCPTIAKEIVFSKNKGLNLFISTGQLDAEKYVDPLTQLFQNKGHKVKFHQTAGGHDFENWNAQLEIMLNFLTNNQE